MQDMETKKIILESVKKAAKNVLGEVENEISIEKPEKENLGDFSTNIALILAGKLHKKPLDLANELADEILSFDHTFKNESLTYPIFKTVQVAAPGFINFYLSDEYLKHGIKEILKTGGKYGASNLGNNKKIIVEYSQPNPNKPMHIGHARNNFLGSSLAEIFKFAGYDVLKVNYLNDWGTHICKSMLMYQKYGKDRSPDQKPDHFVGGFYIMYEQEIENNPELEKELSAMFIKLESGDPDTLELWKKITGWAYEGWEKTYKDENVDFDVWMYQSNYKETGKEIVKTAIERGIAEKDETGAVIARLEEYGIPDKVLLRKDGTSVYATQDMQLAKDSYEKYAFEKRLYVVDNRQTDYFRQLFKILELLGFNWAKRLVHVGYGVVSLPEGGMSSRTGLVVNADDVFSDILELEKEEIATSIKNIDAVEETVHKVALSAFRYGILKVDPKQDIVFRTDQITKFEGNTGPYLLYTYARSQSVIEKSGRAGLNPDFQSLVRIGLHEKESFLLRGLLEFPDFIGQAVERMSPHIVASYLFEIAQRFNSFYGELSVLDAPDDGTREQRIALCICTGQVLKNGLKLLGIDVVDKM